VICIDGYVVYITWAFFLSFATVTIREAFLTFGAIGAGGFPVVTGAVDDADPEVEAAVRAAALAFAAASAALAASARAFIFSAF
jgi:hypothetical protein